MADLALQEPAPGHFSYYDLAWTPVSHRPPPSSGDKAEAVNVQQAKIPWDRVKDFITGEEARGACNFYVRGGQTKKPDQLQKATRKDSHSEFRIYHCVHGPEDDSLQAQQEAAASGGAAAADGSGTSDVGGASATDSQAAAEGAVAADGGAAAPGTPEGIGTPQTGQPKRKNKRMRGEGARVGCQARFKVARPVAEQDAARITWLGSVHHANKEGILVHGPGCEAAQLNPRLAMATHISGSLKDWVAAQIRGKSARADILRANQQFIRIAICNGDALTDEAFELRLKTYPAAQRDYLLKTQDIDNIQKRLKTYALPVDGALVPHPASLGGAAQMPPAEQIATYSAMLNDEAQQQAAAGAEAGAASEGPTARRQRTAAAALEPRVPPSIAQVHDTAQRILNALAAASPDAHKALLGVVVPTLEAVWQRIAGMAPAIAADVEGVGALPAPQPAHQVGQYAAHAPPAEHQQQHQAQHYHQQQAQQQQAQQQVHQQAQQQPLGLRQVPPPLPASLMPPSAAEEVQMALQPAAEQSAPAAAAAPYSTTSNTLHQQQHPQHPGGDNGGAHVDVGSSAAQPVGFPDLGAVTMYADAGGPSQLDTLIAAGQQQEPPQHQNPQQEEQQQQAQEQQHQQQQPRQSQGLQEHSPQPMQQ